jgi:hypothetical protein
MRIHWLGLVFLLACGGSSSPSTSDASGSGDGAIGDGQPGGSVCGGIAHTPCSATEYCDYADNGCGIGDQTGTCTPRPEVCPLNAADPAIAATPTCGCDGKIYGGQCDANRSGVDLNAHGTCDVPAGKFACGYAQCGTALQYCQRQPHTTGPETFSCPPLPAACSTNPGCACLLAQPCSDMCTGTAAAGLTLACAPTA